jgi:hypothetical protein
MTYAAVSNVYKHLPRPKVGNDKLQKLERLSGLEENCG